MAYTRVNWENYPSTATPRNATNLNVMDAGIDNVDTRLTTAEGEIDTAQLEIDNLQSGWNTAGETWTYASVDDPTGVITISGDVTTKYSLGMRIKFTNGGNVIYGIITAISYSSPNTTLTFLHEIDRTDSLALHLMANSAITNNYYSSMKVPYGFPSSNDKWTLIVVDASSRTQTNPTNGTWYNLGNRSITIPVGVWNLFYKCDVWGAATNGRIDLYATLSTANNTQSDTLYSVRNIFSNVSLSGLFAMYSGILNVTSKTTYYLNMRINEATTPTSLGSDGNLSKAVISATCAYL